MCCGYRIDLWHDNISLKLILRGAVEGGLELDASHGGIVGGKAQSVF